MDLHERVALVTGAGRRVGRAIAVRLAGAGCHIAVHYHTSRADAEQTAELCHTASAEQSRAAGSARLATAQVDLFAADLTDPAAATGLVNAVLARFGRLDILVNNASVFESMTLDDFMPAAWERTLRVNLTAPMVLVHAARDALRQARGRVINLCDVSTQRPWPDHLAYMAAKGGLDTLTRALARALAPEVNVVGIAPGVAAWPDNYDAATRARLTARIPLQRPGTPDDIAAAVHWILTGGDYVTGAIIPIDGGRHVV